MESIKKNTKLANAAASFLPPFILIVCILLFWQAHCTINEVPSWQLPKPSEIIAAFFTHFTEALPYLASTYFNIIVGFVLSVVIGIVIALILTNSRILSMALTPIIVVLCCVPMVTLVPLFLVSMGIGPGPKILTIVIQCFPIVNMNACVGFANVDPARLELMESMKATKVEKYRYCIFRDAMPSIFTGVKLASVLAMIAGVSAELCGGTGGLGNQISSLINYSMTAQAFGDLIFVIVLGMALYYFVSFLEKKLTKGM